jgi:mannose-6-phosphate isomerase-like protein (cupin superfamily)
MFMPNRVSAFVVLDGDGEKIRGPDGGPTTIKARAETTNGTFTALENVVAPRQGPPLHIHVREDEMYYILDGHLRFKADDQLLMSIDNREVWFLMQAIAWRPVNWLGRSICSW